MVWTWIIFMLKKRDVSENIWKKKNIYDSWKSLLNIWGSEKVLELFSLSSFMSFGSWFLV